MNCADVRQAIREGRGWDPQIPSHTAGCPACAVLVEAGGQLGLALDAVPLEVPPGVNEAWARIESDRGPRTALKRQPFGQRAVLGILTLLAVVVGILLVKPRPDLSVYPSGRMLYVLSVFSVLVGVGLWIRLRPLHRPPPLWGLRTTSLLVLMGLPFLVAAHPEAITGSPMSMLKGPFWPIARGCFVFGSVTGLSMFAALQLADRRYRAPPIMIMVAAATMGVAGNLSLQLFCPVTAPGHLLAGHASIGVVWAVFLGLGVALRRWLG